MRRVIAWMLVLAALALAGLGVWHVIRESDALPGMEAFQGSSGTAALGLVLVDEADGVYVLAVTSGSMAERAGVHPGDYLLTADGVPLTNAACLNEQAVQADTILLTVRREGQVVPVTLPCK